MSQTGLFDLSARQEQLSRKGDPLERLNEVIDWEDFRPLLKKVRPKPGPRGGRPPYDGVLLFKMLALASLYGLSDEQLEYQVKDRLSFMRFLDLDLKDRVPDATTIWLFREELGRKSGLLDKLFQRFERHLRKAGYEARGGQIIDASLVEVPTRRGKPDDDHEPRSRQQDRDAKWTKKHGRSYFGYKNHISIDRKHKLIRQSAVTDASVHDSRVLDLVLDPDNAGSQVWADSAYRSAETEEWLAEQDYRSRVHHRAWRNRPLNARQRDQNRTRSKIRARVEHVFGHQVQAMGMKVIRTIGHRRVRTKIMLNNLVYNMSRYRFLVSQA